MEGNVKLESLKKFWEGDDRPPGDLMSWIVDQQVTIFIAAIKHINQKSIIF